jgi:hypothetical protein
MKMIPHHAISDHFQATEPCQRHQKSHQPGLAQIIQQQLPADRPRNAMVDSISRPLPLDPSQPHGWDPKLQHLDQSKILNLSLYFDLTRWVGCSIEKVSSL